MALPIWCLVNGRPGKMSFAEMWEGDCSRDPAAAFTQSPQRHDCSASQHALQGN